MHNREMERSVFDLDCNELIPECGCRCGECISEIRETLDKMEGVLELSTEGQGAKTLLIVEHDSAVVSVDQLIDVFASLPTRYEGSFKPSLVRRG